MCRCIGLRVSVVIVFGLTTTYNLKLNLPMCRNDVQERCYLLLRHRWQPFILLLSSAMMGTPRIQFPCAHDFNKSSRTVARIDQIHAQRGSRYTPNLQERMCRRFLDSLSLSWRQCAQSCECFPFLQQFCPQNTHFIDSTMSFQRCCAWSRANA